VFVITIDVGIFGQ